MDGEQKEGPGLAINGVGGRAELLLEINNAIASHLELASLLNAIIPRTKNHHASRQRLFCH